jgi:hypothetical protein
MKKKIFNFYTFLIYFFISFTCYLNLPLLCAFLIKITIKQPKIFKKNKPSKKIIIVLERAVGRRDVEIINNSKNVNFEFVFLQRIITKLILNCFSSKKKFFNYLKPSVHEKEYFNQNKNDRKKHEKFWTNLILNLKKYYPNKSINFITFNYDYYAEAAMYVGCNNNRVPVKLWHKEGIKSDLDAQAEIKEFSKYHHMFKYFSSISVYNNLMKNTFIKIDKTNAKKISVNGFPRINDYIIKNSYQKKIKNILFLSFENRRGIPNFKKYKNLNWQLSYDGVINILNELSHNKKVNIIIKNKHNLTYKSDYKINRKIRISRDTTAAKLINQSDIIIGQNSSATIEALANGKHVMIPLFENKKIYKKYLFNFNNKIIYDSEKKMKKYILTLINKKVTFPLSNIINNNTLKYYFGDLKNTHERYVNFLNK